METRKWVNTLTNEEFVKWGRKFFGTDWDSASVVMSDKEIENASLVILSKPHETTADEDFAEIGCIKVTGWKCQYKQQYKQENWEKYFRVDKDGCAFWTYEGGGEWEDSEIDQIRTIADKKRKEMGWK